MPSLDTNALKARVAIALADAKREILHLERSLGTIDAITHAIPLHRLERDLRTVTPRLTVFFKDAGNQRIATSFQPKPREVIRQPRVRS